MKKGTLYIVATPIGNLEDITFRAIEVLKSVDLIAAEDTRHASRLLDRYGIKTKKISYYDEIEQKRSEELIKKLNDGMNIALISDAGTPGVSDPGYRLIQKTVESKIGIVPIPGASSILAALVASGYATDRFVFEGFLPRKKGRKTRLEELAGESRTIIIFESPVRLLKTLKDLQIYFGERQITVGREITKIYEEFVRGALPEIISHFEQNKPRGEIVIVIEGLTRKVKKGNQ
ncbi:MAG: 16S rRNA (cytidine(1402)-2'-O)-methyltransferase [Candidatus Marinimicrobia bacterium]|nr:16S rRNA (cytidine(1402)-2'-O)-methyltransferase [Candidatus Neomarinimicrobiota bacterium]